MREFVYFCNMNKTYSDMKTLLVQSGIEPDEAKAIALLLMEKVCGMTTTDVLTGQDGTAPTPQEMMALNMAEQVANGMPVQYALGEADFCGMTFRVAPGVLIPRPETEELVDWIVKDSQPSTVNCQLSTVNYLDIGTGSGCIAIALAKRMKEAAVSAWDISPTALHIAQENAARNNVRVTFSQVDVLAPIDWEHIHSNSFDCIVSNPPYICEEEAQEMERHVLEHEPHLALFVPDGDPLVFYRAIADWSRRLLTEDGRGMVEINESLGTDTEGVFRSAGFGHTVAVKDVFDRNRFVIFSKNSL